MRVTDEHMDKHNGTSLSHVEDGWVRTSLGHGQLGIIVIVCGGG